MQPSLAAEYRAKLRTPQEAVRCVKSGDTVYIGCCSSVAYALCEALGARGGELEDVTLVSSSTPARSAPVPSSWARGSGRCTGRAWVSLPASI